MKKVYVIGHRNPDTDSICSAIAYANLKNQVEGNGYEAYRAGNINGETRYVLDTFGIKDPKYVSDVRPRLTDVNLNSVKGAKPTDSLKSVREMMQTEKIVSLPVLDGKKMIGLVSISDVLKADMDVYDNEILAKSKTPYKNVVETLDGTLQTGDIEGYITEGKLTVSAASVDTMEEFVTAKDTAEIELDANREFVRNPEVDLVKVAVVERHQGTGNVACGFLKGYGIKEGAVALSVAHDSHNIIVVGVNDEEMEFAVNSLIEQEGGIVLVKEGKVIESMPMPIAGLMSDQSGEWVDQKLTDIHEKAYEELGICGDVEPVMTLCFMSLAVIPEIKLTDMGLFDVTTFSFIPVEVE